VRIVVWWYYDAINVSTGFKGNAPFAGAAGCRQMARSATKTQKQANKQNIHQLQGILAGIFLSLKLFFNNLCGRVLCDRAIQLTM
jgi:hypothetical protein